MSRTGTAGRVRPAAVASSNPRGPLGVVTPNSRLHWTLLGVGVGASVLFNGTWFVDGLTRLGYDPWAQPISALSLGPGGSVQVANFIVFGVLSCVAAFASRPMLAPGRAATWYPRLRVLAGLTLIGAGLFPQDPAGGYPVGVAPLLTPTLHQQIHNVVSVISLTTTVAELILLALRLRREPTWRGWGAGALAAALLMTACLATFGILISHGGPGGVFEKIAGLLPSAYGIALATRLALRRDARITPPIKRDVTQRPPASVLSR